MSHCSKRPKRLGELLEESSWNVNVDLWPAIEGLESATSGRKIHFTTEEITVGGRVHRVLQVHLQLPKSQTCMH